jgi:Zn-dependent peptidase ImmA (M78 family)
MNTIEKGDRFEQTTLSIMNNAISSGRLGLRNEFCRIYHKKGYYSKDREKEIIFDLAIEVWPPNADRYTLLVLIECKSYSNSNVPVSDVEEFYAKIDQVSGVNAKGIFVTDSDFQEGAFTYARAKGMMLVVVNFDDDYRIVLYKTSQNQVNDEDDAELIHIRELLMEGFSDNLKVEGLKRLSTESIEVEAEKFLSSFNSHIESSMLAVNFIDLFEYIKNKLNLNVVYTRHLIDTKGKQVLGYFDREKMEIGIDIELVGSDRFPFILCHELGHVLLHNDLKINQKRYDLFRDSEYSFILGRRELKNPRQWIEWQANQFSASIILPRKSIIYRLIRYQEANGIRNKGKMHYDLQPINVADFHETINHLARYFGVAKTSVIYRLKVLDVLTYGNDGPVHWTNYFKE